MRISYWSSDVCSSDLLVRERLVAAAHAAAEFEPVEIERLARAQVDHAADTALDQIGGRRLVDINAAEQFGREILKIETPAATGSENVTPVHRGEDLGEATDRHRSAFTTVARNLDARDALQRFGRVAVGQLADVVGDEARKSTRLNSSH